MDTLVPVLVLVAAAFGSVVTLVPVLVEAFGVVTPVFTLVSLVGVALRWCLDLLDAEPLMPVSEIGEAVLAFMPVLVVTPPGEVLICALPVPETPGAATLPLVLTVAFAVGGLAERPAPSEPLLTCAMADVVKASAPQSNAVRMVLCIVFVICGSSVVGFCAWDAHSLTERRNKRCSSGACEMVPGTFAEN
ncbi:MAG TPA: hypothetical protein VLT92_06435 [Burkholderiales bacterium]|nr:hypothetical protein [Burkholderiales bacterium]